MWATPLNRFRSKAYIICKELYQLKNHKGPASRNILFIIGCQRSGTTLMTRILHRDWNAKVYFEDSPLSVQAGDEKLRLKPFQVIKPMIERQPFPLIVLKPLVETQNAVQLLEYFPASRAIWMYRHYKDVAASSVRRFGLENGIKDLRYLVEKQTHDWRAERVPDSVRDTVLSYFSDTMSPYDAAALFWFVRNSLFFELGLDCHPNVLVCQYDELINHPKQTMESIYAFVHRSYPGDHILKMIENSSLGKGRQIVLSKEIESLCKELWGRLESSNHTFIPGVMQKDGVSL